MQHKGKLPRLAPAAYQGAAHVFWTHTTENRARLPDGALARAQLRELLCHFCMRYHLVTPVYCLMPDHLHLLWIGVHPEADQRKATRQFRTAWGGVIGDACLQRQPHDHVVTEQERQRGVYADTVEYILQNPVRTGLVDDWRDYSGIGALVPGYPELEPRDANFRESFWRIHRSLVTRNFG